MRKPTPIRPNTFNCPKSGRTFFTLRRDGDNWFYPDETRYEFDSKQRDFAAFMDFTKAHVEIGQSALFHLDADGYRILRNLGSRDFPYTRPEIATRLAKSERVTIRYTQDDRYYKLVCTLSPKHVGGKAPAFTDGQMDVYTLSPGKWVKFPIRSIMKVEIAA